MSNDSVCRCPCCECVTTVKVEAHEPYVSLHAGADISYFVCQNPSCNVERIYNQQTVMVSGR